MVAGGFMCEHANQSDPSMQHWEGYPMTHHAMTDLDQPLKNREYSRRTAATPCRLNIKQVNRHHENISTSRSFEGLE